MSCTVKTDGPCRRTLNFELERAELEREIEQRLNKIAASSAFKGFRKGKTPIDLVRRTHGKKVTDEARQQLMGQAFSAAVKEHELRPVGDPVLNLQAIDEGDGPVTFELAVEIAPQIDLTLPESFAVTVTLPSIDDELVEGEVGRILERFGKLEELAEGEAIGNDDLLEGDVTYSVDGEHVATHEGKPAFLRHGIVDGIPVEGLSDAFAGKHTGDRVSFTAKLPEHFEPKGWEDREAEISFEVLRHRRLVLPELNEETLKTLGVESEEQLKQRVRAGLESQRTQAAAGQIDRSIEEQLLGSHSIELPERLLAKTIDRKVHEVAHQLMEQRGMQAEEGHEAAEAQREELTKSSNEGLCLAFLLDSIAQAHNLKASPEQAVEQVRVLATREGSDPEQAVAKSIQEGWISEVQEQLSNEQVRAWLRERAQVTEQQPAES